MPYILFVSLESTMKISHFQGNTSHRLVSDAKKFILEASPMPTMLFDRFVLLKKQHIVVKNEIWKFKILSVKGIMSVKMVHRLWRKIIIEMEEYLQDDNMGKLKSY